MYNEIICDKEFNISGDWWLSHPGPGGILCVKGKGWGDGAGGGSEYGNCRCDWWSWSNEWTGTSYGKGDTDGYGGIDGCWDEDENEDE